MDRSKSISIKPILGAAAITALFFNTHAWAQDSGNNYTRSITANSKEMYSSDRVPKKTVWEVSYPFTRVVGTENQEALNPLSEPGKRLSQFNSHAPSYQLDPLDALVTVNYGANKRQVRSAVDDVLAFLGYSLSQERMRECPNMRDLLLSPLPAVHRRFDGVSAKELLRALAGPGYTPAVDYVRRTISFEPADGRCSIGRPRSGYIVPPHTHGGYIRSIDPQTTIPLEQDHQHQHTQEMTPATRSDTVYYDQPPIELSVTRTDGSIIGSSSSPSTVDTPSIKPSIAPIHPKTPLKTSSELHNSETDSAVVTGSSKGVISTGDGSALKSVADKQTNGVVNEWYFGEHNYVRETIVSPAPDPTVTYPVRPAEE